MSVIKGRMFKSASGRAAGAGDARWVNVVFLNAKSTSDESDTDVRRFIFHSFFRGNGEETNRIHFT